MGVKQWQTLCKGYEERKSEWKKRGKVDQIKGTVMVT